MGNINSNNKYYSALSTNTYDTNNITDTLQLLTTKATNNFDKDVQNYNMEQIETYLTTSHLKSLLLNWIYPIGSVYFSMQNTSPAFFLGGTWTSIATGKFIKTTTSTSGQTGGSSTVTLTSANLPSHSHSISQQSHTHSFSGGSHNHQPQAGNKFITCYDANIRKTTHRALTSKSGDGYCYLISDSDEPIDKSTDTTSVTITGAIGSTTTGATSTGSVGSGTSFNNEPPYITLYAWRRTR